MKKPRFNLTGITLIVFLGVFVVFIIFGSSIYQNIKKVEHNVFNLYQQVRTTNSKIDQFGVADEEMAQQSLKFTEATKNWQMYQNEEFGFQLKNPVSWGSLEYALSEQAEAGKHSSANFTHFRDGSPLRLAVTTYDYQAEAAVVNYANRELYNTLLHNKVGECNDKVFGVLNNLKIGEIRNCFVRENILKQKFILFRRVQALEDKTLSELSAVYTRSTYFLQISLPDEILDEIDYFIQSVVFMK